MHYRPQLYVAFSEIKRIRKSLESAMTSEGTGMSSGQDISTDHPVPISFLINQNPILKVCSIARPLHSQLCWKSLFKVRLTTARTSVWHLNKAYISMHIDMLVLRAGDIVREES